MMVEIAYRPPHFTPADGKKRISGMFLAGGRNSDQIIPPSMSHRGQQAQKSCDVNVLLQNITNWKSVIYIPRKRMSGPAVRKGTEQTEQTEQTEHTEHLKT
jgi:hypothetical protein